MKLVDLIPEWKLQGLCVQHQEINFFSRKPKMIERARALCASCPVAVQCSDYQESYTHEYGVWAGQEPRRV